MLADNTMYLVASTLLCALGVMLKPAYMRETTSITRKRWVVQNSRARSCEDFKGLVLLKQIHY